MAHTNMKPAGGCGLDRNRDAVRRARRFVDLDATVPVGSSRVRILGTIAGFLPDGERVAAALRVAPPPSAIALGVPADDLPGLARLAADADPASLIDPSEKRLPRGVGPTGGQMSAASPLHPSVPAPIPDDGDPDRFAGLDAATAHMLSLLRRFGPTSSVPSDLVAAQRAATRLGLPVVAVDLDDEAHTAVVTSEVGMLGLVGRSRAERRALAGRFEDAPDAAALAVAFDAVRCGTRGLRRVEEAREVEMAARLRALTSTHAALVAVVPAARFAGVVARLSQA